MQPASVGDFGDAMRRRVALALLVLLLAGPAAGRKHRHKTTSSTNTKKRECEKHVCSGHNEDDKANCVLRCQSEDCYAEVYGNDELEPGEIDTRRARVFQTCLTNEQKQKQKQKRAGGTTQAETTAAATEL